MKELSEAERGFLTNFCDMDLQGAEGAVAVADGILRVSQGDTVEGVFEATMGAIGTGAILSSVYALKGAKAIDGADDFIESYADLMSPEDAKKYLEFLENGSTAGLTPEELAGIDKLDELLALEKVEWDDVVRIRADVYKRGKIGFEHLDEQLGSLKDIVEVKQYQSAESVNGWWEARGYKSPYKEQTVVQELTLLEDAKFVRVYDGVNSQLEGGWIMKVEDIKGLTAKDIQEKFALEYEPVFVGEVKLKAGDIIRLGEVGPNFGFNGGGIQIDLKQQWIGEFVEIGRIEDWR